MGTSSEKEARECFNDFEKNLITYIWGENDKIHNKESKLIDENDSESSMESQQTKSEEEEEDHFKDRNSDSYKAITLAFDKRFSNSRKKWLEGYNPDSIIENNEKFVTYHDFVHKDLIHFSNSDNMRSLPSICDGLKPSQRKVVFASFLRKLDKDEVKVSQLAGYTSDKSAYHHGEVSLQGTIINMAQNFIGSNNINILMPNGQFGTRRMGGKDSASARYLHTMFNKISQKIFRKEDEHIYQHIIDDGHVVEPINYSPIVPMVLVNGSEGIGTGFSTNIPCFNPISIVNSIYKRMDGKEFKELVPWYRGFKGTIKKLNEKSYESCGVFKIVSGNKIHIKEIPVGMWTQNYRDHLEYLLIDDPKKPKKHEIIIDYKDNSGNNNVDIMVELTNGSLQKLIKNKLIEKNF